MLVGETHFPKAHLSLLGMTLWQENGRTKRLLVLYGSFNWNLPQRDGEFTSIGRQTEDYMSWRTETWKILKGPFSTE